MYLLLPLNSCSKLSQTSFADDIPLILEKIVFVTAYCRKHIGQCNFSVDLRSIFFSAVESDAGFSGMVKPSWTTSHKSCAWRNVFI